MVQNIKQVSVFTFFNLILLDLDEELICHKLARKSLALKLSNADFQSLVELLPQLSRKLDIRFLDALPEYIEKSLLFYNLKPS